jgi:hypothetical protein
MASKKEAPATNSQGHPSLFYPDQHHRDNLKKYEASCHCGTIQFTLLLPPLDTIPVYNCNCSICDINGYLNVYPFSEDIEWITSPEVLERSLGKYRWNRKLREHQFCKECGTSLCIDFSGVGESLEKPHMAVNARTLKGVDWRELDLKPFDGRHLFPGPEDKK